MMNKETCQFLNDLRKRPPEKPLSFGELISLRELGYINLKSDVNALELMLKYCQNPKFQIRICEKAFLMTTLLPLVQVDNPVDVIKYGTKALAYLSSNKETHYKFQHSDSISTIINLCRKNIQYEITKNSLEVIANLSENLENHQKILWDDKLKASKEPKEFKDRNILKYLILELLDNVPAESQSFIMKICYNLSGITEYSYWDQIHKILLKTKYLEPIFRCMAALNENVVLSSLETIKNLISINENQDKLIKLNIHGRLAQTYNAYKNTQNLSIIETIVSCFRQLLKNTANQNILAKEKFIKIFIEMIHSTNFEIGLLSSICLSQMAESVESHDKLVELDVLNIMCIFLKEGKHVKLHHQSCRFLANISWNPKFQQLLIQKGVIDILLASLSSNDKSTLTQSILALSNLSSAQNFHQYASEMNIKLLIHTLDSNDPKDAQLLRAAANTLSNLSADFQYHEYFLKEPEFTTLLKILQFSDDIRLIKSIVIIITNISTNISLINKLTSGNSLEIIIKLFERERSELIGYLSKTIAGLSIGQECRKYIIAKEIISKLISNTYRCDTAIKKEILISIMTILHNSEDLHEEFLQKEGIGLLIYFLNKIDAFLSYISCKCFVLLSRNEKNMKFICKKSIYNKIFNCAMEKDLRILKEGIRFLINLYIHGMRKKSILNFLCLLIDKGLKEKESDVLNLSLFCLMIISENEQNHSFILNNERSLLKNLAAIRSEEVVQFALFYTTFLMNFSMNPKNGDYLLELKFVQRLREIVNDVDESCHCYVQTFISHIIRILKFDDFFKQKGHEILIFLLDKDYSYLLAELLESIHVICRCTFEYPEDLLKVIPKICEPINLNVDEEKEIMLRIKILSHFSYNTKSIEFFRESQLFELINTMMKSPFVEKLIPDCCVLLANISKDDNIMRGFMEQESLKMIILFSLKSELSLKKTVIRLIANITSHDYFKQTLLTKIMVTNLFKFITRSYYTDIKNRMDLDITLNSVLISFLNLSRLNYGIVQALAKEKLVHKLTDMVMDNSNQIWLSLCFLTLSNMMISREMVIDYSFLIEKTFEKLEFIFPSSMVSPREKVVQTQEENLLQVSFLKLLHNMIVSNPEFIDRSLTKKVLDRSITIFLKIDDENLKSIILNSLNILFQNKKNYDYFRQNKDLILAIFEILIKFGESPIKKDSSNNSIITSCLFAASFITHYEDSLEIYQNLLNFKDFFSKFRQIYNNLQSRKDRLCMINIFTNLVFLKEMHHLVIKHQKVLSIISEIFQQSQDSNDISNDLLSCAINFLANISHNSNFHTFIACDEILGVLSKSFLNGKCQDEQRTLIRKILANTSFSPNCHENLIKHRLIDICDNINSKESIISLINIGLNSKNFALIENQANLINSLELIKECDKPLQTKLLEAASHYVLESKPEESQENKKRILEQIMKNIIVLLDSKSNYLIKNLSYMLPLLANNDLFLNIGYDGGKLIEELVMIIIKHENNHIKKLNLQTLTELTKTKDFFQNCPDFYVFLEKLFHFSHKKLNKMIFSKGMSNRFDYIIIYFLKILSHSALFGLQEQKLKEILLNKELENFLFNSMKYAKKYSFNLLAQTICTYANFFQTEVLALQYNYGIIIQEIQADFKSISKKNQRYEFFILGFLLSLLKSKNFNLKEFSSPQKQLLSLFSEISQINSQNPNLNNTTNQMLMQLQSPRRMGSNDDMIDNQSNLSRVASFNVENPDLVNEEENKKNEDTSVFENEHLNFLFLFLNNCLKKFRKMEEDVENEENSENLLMLLLGNIAFLGENHKFIYKTNLIETLMKYLMNEVSLVRGNYKLALIASLNLATNHEFFNRVMVSDLYNLLEKLNVYNKDHLLEYGSVFLILMSEHSSLETFEPMLEKFIEFTVLNILKSCEIGNRDDLGVLDKSLTFISNLIKRPNLILRISKIPSLFKELFRIVLSFDPKLHKERFQEIYKFWEVMKIFIDDKACFSEIVTYGFVELIKYYVSLLSVDYFIDNPNLHIPLETTNTTNNESFLFNNSSKSLKPSTTMIEKTSQKLSLISLILHALDGLMEFDFPIEKIRKLTEISSKSSEKLIEQGEGFGNSNSRLSENNDKDKPNDKKEKSPSHEKNLEINLTLKPEQNVLAEKSSDPVNIKLIYASKEQKGFSEYVESVNHPVPLSPIYLSFDFLYDVLESFIKMLTPINNKDSVACYCNMAEVTRNISKVLIAIKDVDFEHITKVLNSLASGCVFKQLEPYLNTYPIFDYIIEACYLIHEKFKFSVEKQIGAILESIIREKSFFKPKVLKKHIYLYFLNTISKLNFKKISWDLKTSLNDIVEILVMNLSNFSDSIYAYYLLIIMKQIVLHYDIKTFPGIFDHINELLKYTFNILSKFTENLQNENENKVSTDNQEIDKYVLIFSYENLLLLIYFNEFHHLLISLNLFKISLTLGSTMLNLFNNINNTNQETLIKKNIFRYKEDELLNLLKLILMMINHATYYMVFHEHLAQEDMLSFLLELLISNIKQLQLISFNSIINLIEANGLVLVKKLLEISMQKIDSINQLLIHKKNEKKVNLEPFLSILEHIYFSKDLFLNSDTEEENKEIKNFIGLLVTNVIIEKHELKLSKKILDIVIKEAYLSVEIEARLLMILLKIIHFSEGLIIDLRDTVLEFFRCSLKHKQELISKNDNYAANLALISIPTIKKFINTDIRNFKDIISLENVFFWEYCSDQHTYDDLTILCMVMTLMFFKILIRISNFMRNLLVETNYFEILEGIVTQENMQGNLGYLILKLICEIFWLLTANKSKVDELKNSNLYKILENLTSKTEAKELLDQMNLIRKNLNIS